MSEFVDMAAGAAGSLVEDAARKVRGGQAASLIMADPIMSGFFSERIRQIVMLLMEVDTQDSKATEAAVLALQALGALHNHLTQAVTSGLAAAQRLSEKANEGEAT